MLLHPYSRPPAIRLLDGDGHEDVFLSQNFFATPLEMPRLDAGRGLWLRGDGTGNLTPLRGQDSGVKVSGFGCQPGDHYPRATHIVMHKLPKKLATMPNPCEGVPANPWCGGKNSVGVVKG